MVWEFGGRKSCLYTAGRVRLQTERSTPAPTRQPGSPGSRLFAMRGEGESESGQGEVTDVGA